jgi:hypothetical protein
MPAPPPQPRNLTTATYTARGFFGAGFLVLGALALYKVAVAAAPPGNKIMGGALGVAMILLGIYRIRQYLLWRREST